MKFSIVVATYNREVALKRCVDAILNQDYPDLELIVVDDGSTDNTSAMMASYDDDRLHYITLEKNHGSATPARNRGIDESTGDVLIVWDSDDELLPNALAVLHEGFVENPSVGIACTSTDFYVGDRKQNYNRIDTAILSPVEWFAGKKPRDAEIIGIKRELVGDVRFEARGIDYVFYAKIAARAECEALYINETCGKIFLESDELSLTTARKKRNNDLSVLRASILDDFLNNEGQWYIKAGRFKRYAGIAFGVAVGYVLKGDKVGAKKNISRALQYHWTPVWFLMMLVLLLPGGISFVKWCLKKRFI